MTTLSRTELQALAAPADDLRVSIYLPVQQAWPGAQENALRLRAALDDAERQLQENGLTGHDARQFLKAARDFEHEGGPPRGSRVAGLAVLAGPDFLRTELLPYSCPQSVDVAYAFYLAPLLRGLTWPAEFHLLALSENHARLYRGSRDGLLPVELPSSVPRSLEDYLTGTEVGQPIRFHSGIGVGQGSPEQSVIHGQTSYRDDAQVRLHEYVQALAKGVELLVRHDPLPLVLTAVGRLHPIFRDVYHGPGLTEPGLHGSPDALTEPQLHEQAVQFIEEHFDGELRDACDRFQKIADTAQASHQLEEIIPAACQGRVDSIIAAFGQRVWGTWDARNQLVTIEEGQTTLQQDQTDLLDLALRESLRHGGHVYVVPPEYVPDGGAVAAVLRW